MLTIIQALRDMGVSVSDRSQPFQIRCPFHGTDLHPSARVYPADNSFYCWTCKKTYTPVSAIAAYHGITFIEALQSVEEKYGASTNKRVPVGRRLDNLLSELIKCTADIPQAEKALDDILCRAGRGDSEARIMEMIYTLFSKHLPRLAPRPR